MLDIAVTSRRIEDIYREVVEDAHAGDDADKGPLVLHVIPTPAGRGTSTRRGPWPTRTRYRARRPTPPGAQPLRRRRGGAGRLLAPLPGRSGPAAGFDPRLVWRLRTALAAHDPAVVVAHGSDPLKFLVPAIVDDAARSSTTSSAPTPGRPTAACSSGCGAGCPAGPTSWPPAATTSARSASICWRCPRTWWPWWSTVGTPERFAPRPPGPPAAEPLVVFVGALARPSGRPASSRWWPPSGPQGQPLRAQVVGEGPLGSDLVPAAAAAKVDLLGRRPDVPELLRQADLLVFPSEAAGEGMPGVLIEAGLSGLPVVATAVPGVSTIVEDGRTGLVVDVDDFGALVSATGRLLADTQLRAEMGRAARARCLDRFSMAAAVTRRWSAVLDPLLTRRP